MTHDDDNCPHLVRANLLDAENARLKAEVERLTKALEEEAACQVGHQENAILIGRLEAEVERLTKASQGAVKYVDHTMALARQSTEHHKEVTFLKAEVERLKKQAKGMSEAGWSLVNAHQYDASIFYWNKCINDWQNADKGVQS
jgi:uncharacterized coiled-coil DUF342 family protein